MNDTGRKNQIQQHFEAEAKEYDDLIYKLIPHYSEMLQAVLCVFVGVGKTPKVADLGCGTGTLASAVLSLLPAAQVDLFDVSQNMLDIAEAKLAGYPQIRAIHGDFSSITGPKKYDVIISSLALHHLETDQEKEVFFQSIYGALQPGGWFVNADVVLGATEEIQGQYMEKWKDFMLGQVSLEEVENRWLVKYAEEDRPARLDRQLSWLQGAGFEPVEVFWKCYNFAVYGGRKPLV